MISNTDQQIAKSSGDQYFIKQIQKISQNSQTLSFDRKNISHIGLKKLHIKPWNNITRINICYNEFGSKGLKIIASISWRSIQYFGLRQCNLNDDSLKHLAKMQSQKLHELWMTNNYFSDKAIIHLLKGNWKKFNTLYLRNYGDQGKSTTSSIQVLGLVLIDSPCFCTYYGQTNNTKLNTKHIKDCLNNKFQKFSASL